MKRFTLAGLLISSSLLAAMGANMPTFADYDTNKDGKISKEEFKLEQQTRMQQKSEEGKMMRNAANAPSFSDLDTNGDGYISKYEFQNHQKERMQERRQNMQMNKTGPGMNKCSGQGMGGPGMGQGMGQGKNQ